jgi:argininosuccinate synthase
MISEKKQLHDFRQHTIIMEVVMEDQNEEQGEIAASEWTYPNGQPVRRFTDAQCVGFAAQIVAELVAMGAPMRLEELHRFRRAVMRESKDRAGGVPWRKDTIARIKAACEEQFRSVQAQMN